MLKKNSVDGEPTPVVDTTLSSPGGINWDAIVKVITASQPILLALIGFFTIYYGNKASNSAEDAKVKVQAVAEAVDSNAMVRDEQLQEIQAKQETLQDTADSTHMLVNSAKSALERKNRLLKNEMVKYGIPIPKELQ